MQKTISITEGRRRLFQIAKEVQNPDTTYVLTDKGKPKMMVMSPDEYDSIIETMEILSDTNLLNDIKLAEEDYKAGKTITLDELLGQSK